MGSMIWDLGDPALDLLMRAGVGGMALALDAADAEGHDLGHLRGTIERRSLHLSWPDDVTDQDALGPLVKWAWQARGAPVGSDPKERLGVLYFPGVHRGSARDNVLERLGENNGVLSTFLQHPRVQPKTKPFEGEVELDGASVAMRYVEPATLLRPVADFDTKLFKRRALRTDNVDFSSWLVPGATARYSSEYSWDGPVKQALPLLFAPTACFYLKVGASYVVVVPEVRDLEVFMLLRPEVRLGATGQWAASAGDAGLRVLVAWRARALAQAFEDGTGQALQCDVVKIGKVSWNKQYVRNKALRLQPSAETIARFEALDRALRNQIRPRSDGSASFVSIPSPRGRIADNLVTGAYWYHDLFEPLSDQRGSVEKQRKPNESAQRTWFRLVGYDRAGLRDLIKEMLTMEDPKTAAIDEAFVAAFHEALRRLYGKEAEAAKRGSRSPMDRINDRTEQVRRELTRAQSRHLLRSVLADFFAESGRTEPLQTNHDAIWRFIDGAHSWRRARDLALLSLATYKGRALDQTPDEPVPEQV